MHITLLALLIIIIEVEVIIGVLVSSKAFPCVMECKGSQSMYKSDDIIDLVLLTPAHLLQSSRFNRLCTTQASYHEGSAGLRLP